MSFDFYSSNNRKLSVESLRQPAADFEPGIIEANQDESEPGMSSENEPDFDRQPIPHPLGESTTDQGAENIQDAVGFQTGETDQATTEDEVMVMQPVVNDPHGAFRELKAKTGHIVTGFVQQLIDFEAFHKLDPEIQTEIVKKYPELFDN